MARRHPPGWYWANGPRYVQQRRPPTRTLGRPVPYTPDLTGQPGATMGLPQGVGPLPGPQGPIDPTWLQGGAGMPGNIQPEHGGPYTLPPQPQAPVHPAQVAPEWDPFAGGAPTPPWRDRVIGPNTIGNFASRERILAQGGPGIQQLSDKLYQIQNQNGIWRNRIHSMAHALAPGATLDRARQQITSFENNSNSVNGPAEAALARLQHVGQAHTSAAGLARLLGHYRQSQNIRRVARGYGAQ